jgi:hypothetical protein
MMGQHDRSESLFYYFRIEDQVPENHLLRFIDRYALREVHAASVALAKKRRQPAFVIPPSRLHDIESKNILGNRSTAIPTTTIPISPYCVVRTIL